MEQMTIFELVTDARGRPWQEMRDEELGDYIASRFSRVAKTDASMGWWMFELDGCVVRYHRGRYYPGVNNGAEMISVDVIAKSRIEGCGSACDSLEEAVEFIRHSVKRLRGGEKR